MDYKIVSYFNYLLGTLNAEAEYSRNFAQVYITMEAAVLKYWC